MQPIAERLYYAISNYVMPIESVTEAVLSIEETRQKKSSCEIAEQITVILQERPLEVSCILLQLIETGMMLSYRCKLIDEKKGHRAYIIVSLVNFVLETVRREKEQNYKLVESEKYQLLNFARKIIPYVLRVCRVINVNYEIGGLNVAGNTNDALRDFQNLN